MTVATPALPSPDWENEKFGVKLWCCDCRTLLPLIPKGVIDAVVTDPPYGINHSSAHGASWMNTKIAGDSDTSLRDTVLVCFQNVAAHGTWKTPPIEDTKGVLVWDKGPAFGMGDLSFPWKASWELIYIRGKIWAGRRDEGVLRGPVVVSWESKGRTHPHEKPVWISRHLISKIPCQSLVFDPFMGTCPVGIASVQYRNPFWGCEIHRPYFDIAVDRISKAIEEVEQDMFGPDLDRSQREQTDFILDERLKGEIHDPDANILPLS